MSILSDILEQAERRDPHEIEFLETLSDIFHSLEPLKDKINVGVFKKLAEPERVIMFAIPWVDDHGNTQVNRGYRVQYSSALGPYKGGLRFHQSVNLSTIKFLALEQTLKNALTGLQLGGAKGGSDFDPHHKSDQEIMRFCQSFMTELYKHIGPHTDIPAGDIGVGQREIGYLFGQYKRLTTTFNGAVTGKAANYGGSLLRPEATGFGLIYFVQLMLQKNNLSLSDKRIIISGSGNVAIGAAEKAIELGATVIAMSDSKGVIHHEAGINLKAIKQIKLKDRGDIKDYLKLVPEATYLENACSIWNLECDIALPCATQNELNEEHAQKLLDNNCLLVAEGANKPCSQKAVELLNGSILFGPAKAANAGGVIVSSFEMSQNASFDLWSKEVVDEKLKKAMKDIFEKVSQFASDYDQPGNYLLGADLAGFKRLADAMMAQGVV